MWQGTQCSDAPPLHPLDDLHGAEVQKKTCGSTVFSTGHPRQYSLAPAMLVCADRTRRGRFIAVWPQIEVKVCVVDIYLSNCQSTVNMDGFCCLMRKLGGEQGSTSARWCCLSQTFCSGQVQVAIARSRDPLGRGQASGYFVFATRKDWG